MSQTEQNVKLTVKPGDPTAALSPGRQRAHLWWEAVTGKSLGRKQWQPPARDEPAQTAVGKVLAAAPSPLATLTLRELVMPFCLSRGTQILS